MTMDRAGRPEAVVGPGVAGLTAADLTAARLLQHACAVCQLLLDRCLP